MFKGPFSTEEAASQEQSSQIINGVHQSVSGTFNGRMTRIVYIVQKPTTSCSTSQRRNGDNDGSKWLTRTRWECWCDLQDESDKMANGKTAHENTCGAEIDGTLLQAHLFERRVTLASS